MRFTPPLINEPARLKVKGSRLRCGTLDAGRLKVAGLLHRNTLDAFASSIAARASGRSAFCTQVPLLCNCLHQDRHSREVHSGHVQALASGVMVSGEHHQYKRIEHNTTLRLNTQSLSETQTESRKKKKESVCLPMENIISFTKNTETIVCQLHSAYGE